MHENRLVRISRAVVLTGVSMLIGIAVNAQTAPDNTKVNRRDRAPSAVTADQQKNNAGDREITRKIRQSLIKDKTLSSYAHNIKVIAQGGQVTLKDGGVLLSVHCDTSEEIARAKGVLTRTGAEDISSAGEQAVGASSTARDAHRA